jgi:hypothetical protein
VEAIGASIDRNDSHRLIVRRNRSITTVSSRFQLFPAPLKPVLLPLPPVVVEEATVVATGPLEASKEPKRQS